MIKFKLKFLYYFSEEKQVVLYSVVGAWALVMLMVIVLWIVGKRILMTLSQDKGVKREGGRGGNLNCAHVLVVRARLVVLSSR